MNDFIQAEIGDKRHTLYTARKLDLRLGTVPWSTDKASYAQPVLDQVISILIPQTP